MYVCCEKNRLYRWHIAAWHLGCSSFICYSSWVSTDGGLQLNLTRKQATQILQVDGKNKWYFSCACISNYNFHYLWAFNNSRLYSRVGVWRRHSNAFDISISSDDPQFASHIFNASIKAFPGTPFSAAFLLQVTNVNPIRPECCKLCNVLLQFLSPTHMVASFNPRGKI